MSKDVSGTYFQRIHALDLAMGTELMGGPTEIQATFPGTGDGTNGTDVVFAPGQYKQRVGLLLLNGTVYLGWASHCDIRPYTGWIMRYNANTLAQTRVLNVVPNGSEGAIWMAGAGLAADSSGNIYFLDANGDFDSNLTNGFPTTGNFGNAFLKLSTASGLRVADYFENGQSASGEQHRSRPRLRQRAAAARSQRRSEHHASRRWRWQGHKYLRREPRFDGEVQHESQQQQRLSGTSRRPARRRLVHAGLF